MPFMITCDTCNASAYAPDRPHDEHGLPDGLLACPDPEATGCCTEDHHHGLAVHQHDPAAHEGDCAKDNPACPACRPVTITALPGSAAVRLGGGPGSNGAGGATAGLAGLAVRALLTRFLLGRLLVAWFLASPATILERARQTSLLASILNGTTWPAVPTGWKMRLTSNAPTVTVAGTEITAGTGYTAGGTAFTSQTVAAAATTLPVAALSWTNGGATWSIVGLEIWDIAGTPLRWLWGLWTGQPISVAGGNTFQVAINAVSADATPW